MSGNLSGHQSKNATSKPPFSLSQPGILQRTCACGGVAGLTGECEECSSKRLSGQRGIKPPSLLNEQPTESRQRSPLGGYNFGELAIQPKERWGIQTKLAIRQPGDRYEQEADRVAEQVMRMAPRTPPSIQRQPEDEGLEEIQRESYELTHVVQQNNKLSNTNIQLQSSLKQPDIPIIQRVGEFRDRPPTAIEAAVHSFADHDAMGEFLAGSSSRMLETQTALQNANPETQEQAEQYEAQIESLLRLNAIGLMASHKATIEGKRNAMLSTEEGESRVKPLRDTAANIHELEQTQERLEEYKRNLKSVESQFFQRGTFFGLFSDELNDALDELALNSNRYISSSERRDMIARYEAVLESGSRNRMWLFVYGSAQYMQRKRKSQIDAVKAALSLIFQNFPVFSQLDAEDVVDGDYANDRELEREAGRSFAKVLETIDDTIRDIHSGDKNPLDMPEVIRTTRQELPESLKQVLDDMKADHQQFRFWRDIGLTATEILLAFVPVIGPALALGVAVASLAVQGEELMDQMEMADVGANPYGNNPLGVDGPSVFEKTMFGVTAVLSVAGLGSVVGSLRGGRAAASAVEETAEAAIRGSDELLEGGASVADDLAEGATRSGDEILEEGSQAATRSGNEVLTNSERLERVGTVNDKTLELFEARPELLDALSENPMAARLLKHCSSPCFPEKIADWQVDYLQDFLEELSSRNLSLEDINVNPQRLRQQLEEATDDDAVTGIFHELERKLDIAEDTADTGRRGVLLDDSDLGSSIDDGLDRIENSGMVSRQGAHDIGVSHGRQFAKKFMGLRDVNWVNPFEFRRSRFGQGFDDIMEDASGNIWIIEYKGGKAALSRGQMTEGWVRRRLARYRRQGGKFWADKLQSALNEGRLRGVALSTPIKERTVGKTSILKIWNY